MEIFRRQVARVMGTTACGKYLVKIARVQQPNRRTRFDLFVDRELNGANTWHIKLKSKGQGWLWHVRRHRPFLDRQEGVTRILHKECRTSRVAAAALEVRKSTRLRLCTWNINGLGRKKPEIKYLIEKHQPDVLALQETLQLPEDYLARFRDFQVYSTPGERKTSQRGVSLIVLSRFSSKDVPTKGGNSVAARIFGAQVQQN